MLIKTDGSLRRLRGRDVRRNAHDLLKEGVPKKLVNMMIVLAEEQMHHEHLIQELMQLNQMCISALDEIGGNSELIMKAMSEVERKLGVKLELNELAPQPKDE